MTALDSGQLIREHQAAVYNYVRRMLWNHEDAADLTQEVFISVLTHVDRDEYPNCSHQWMTKILQLFSPMDDEDTPTVLTNGPALVHWREK